MRFLAFDRHPGGIAQTRAASQLPRRLSSFARVSAAFVLAGVPKESPALLGAASLLLELPRRVAANHTSLPPPLGLGYKQHLWPKQHSPSSDVSQLADTKD